MKFMISTNATQADYDAMGGKPGADAEWSPEDFAAMGAFMESFNREFDESGELVELAVWTPPRTLAGSNSRRACRS